MDETFERKKRKPWKTQEEELLIKIWGKHIHELRGIRQNYHIFEKIRLELYKYGCKVSVMEIKYKTHNLTSKYRKEKALLGRSGGSVSTWNHFYKIHNILGTPNNNNTENVEEEILQEDDNMSDPIGVKMLEDFYESNSDHSDSSVSFPPTPVASESVTRSSPSPSPTPIPAAVKKNKQPNFFQNELLKRLDKIEQNISQQNAELKEMDKKMYKNELKKTELMERFVKSSEEYKNAVVSYMKRKC